MLMLARHLDAAAPTSLLLPPRCRRPDSASVCKALWWSQPRHLARAGSRQFARRWSDDNASACIGLHRAASGCIRGDRLNVSARFPEMGRCIGIFMLRYRVTRAMPGARGAGTRRGRAHGTSCCALPYRGIAPRDRPHRPRSWGPADPRPTRHRPTPGGSQALLGGKVRDLPAAAPACHRSPDAAGRAIPPRISAGDGEVAVVLAAWCGEHGAGARRDSRDRSHEVCITIGLHDLR